MEKTPILKEAKANTEPVNTVTTENAKAPKILTAEIACIDCGATRIVGKGEVFQVKRCVTCQEKHRKSLRKQYRKNRISSLKSDLELCRDRLVNAGAEIIRLREQLK